MTTSATDRKPPKSSRKKMPSHGGVRLGAGRKAGGKNSTPPKPGKEKAQNRTICLQAASWEKLADLAEAQGISKNKLAARVLQEWLEKQG